MGRKIRKKPSFRCYKCKKNLKSAFASAEHFKENPSHRNAKQKKDYLANKALAEDTSSSRYQRRVTTGLPTKRITTRTRSGLRKFCTDCGERRMPSHNYCGGCGDRL